MGGINVLTNVDELDYEQVVALHHQDLYRFAFSLAGNADEAGELTQESYYRLLTRGGQLREPSKVKSWLFTTLYRLFLRQKRHSDRFPHLAISSVKQELPALTPQIIDGVDGALVLDTLCEIDEHHRTPLMLFYLQSFSYREIAEMLEVPIGTIMSRLARGKDVLRERLTVRAAGRSSSNVVNLRQPNRRD